MFEYILLHVLYFSPRAPGSVDRDGTVTFDVIDLGLFAAHVSTLRPNPPDGCNITGYRLGDLPDYALFYST